MQSTTLQRYLRCLFGTDKIQNNNHLEIIYTNDKEKKFNKINHFNGRLSSIINKINKIENLDNRHFAIFSNTKTITPYDRTKEGRYQLNRRTKSEEYQGNYRVLVLDIEYLNNHGHKLSETEQYNLFESATNLIDNEILNAVELVTYTGGGIQLVVKLERPITHEEHKAFRLNMKTRLKAVIEAKLLDSSCLVGNAQRLIGTYNPLYNCDTEILADRENDCKPLPITEDLLKETEVKRIKKQIARKKKTYSDSEIEDMKRVWDHEVTYWIDIDPKYQVETEDNPNQSKWYNHINRAVAAIREHVTFKMLSEKFKLVELEEFETKQVITSPWREDNAPSLAYYADTELLYDFGTGESMDVIQVYQNQIGTDKSIDLPRAVMNLVEVFGLGKVRYKRIENKNLKVGRKLNIQLDQAIKILNDAKEKNPEHFLGIDREELFEVIQNPYQWLRMKMIRVYGIEIAEQDIIEGFEYGDRADYYLWIAHGIPRPLTRFIMDLIEAEQENQIAIAA